MKPTLEEGISFSWRNSCEPCCADRFDNFSYVTPRYPIKSLQASSSLFSNDTRVLSRSYAKRNCLIDDNISTLDVSIFKEISTLGFIDSPVKKKKKKRRKRHFVVIEIRWWQIAPWVFFIGSARKSGWKVVRVIQESIGSSVFPGTGISCLREEQQPTRAFLLWKEMSRPSTNDPRIFAGFSRYCREIGVAGIPRIGRIDILQQ